MHDLYFALCIITSIGKISKQDYALSVKMFDKSKDYPMWKALGVQLIIHINSWLQFFLIELCWGKAMVPYTKPS